MYCSCRRIKRKFELDNAASNVDNSLNPEVVKAFQQVSTDLEEVKSERAALKKEVEVMNISMNKLVESNERKDRDIER